MSLELNFPVYRISSFLRISLHGSVINRYTSWNVLNYSSFVFKKKTCKPPTATAVVRKTLPESLTSDCGCYCVSHQHLNKFLYWFNCQSPGSWQRKTSVWVSHKLLLCCDFELIILSPQFFLSLMEITTWTFQRVILTWTYVKKFSIMKNSDVICYFEVLQGQWCHLLCCFEMQRI